MSRSEAMWKARLGGFAIGVEMPVRGVRLRGFSQMAPVKSIEPAG
jgi:hypothetical protein